MLTNPDFIELLNLFEKYKVRYLVAGGYAVMKYSEPRFTKDLDIWIATDPVNAQAVFMALKEFGAPLMNLSAEDFSQSEFIYQMGRAPLRVDIMMSIDGVEFETAWTNRVIVELNNLQVPFISRSDLICTKEASGRMQDKLDLEKLRQAEQSETDLTI